MELEDDIADAVRDGAAGAALTVSYPLTVWALVEDAGRSTRHLVVGVDAGGQWPGGVDNDPGADFIRYIYQAPEDGHPEDLFIVPDDVEGVPP